MRTCKVCGTSIEGKRRQAVYCGPNCAKQAQRLGLARTEVERKPAIPVTPSAVPRRQRKPSMDDIARLFVQALGVAAAFKFAATRADYRFRPMCTRMADAIIAAIESEGVEE